VIHAVIPPHPPLEIIQHGLGRERHATHSCFYNRDPAPSAPSSRTSTVTNYLPRMLEVLEDISNVVRSGG
ncbi:hypothetical protein NZA98_25205, partial [Escherichia coli]|nr:hypothetical protein [Escherichia coli]